MKLRAFTAFVFLLAGTVPAHDAAALGLGDATLKSRLNEPLEIEIALFGENLDTDPPAAAIGRDRDAAESPGFERLTQLRAEVVADATHPAHVRIRTDRAVREPFVSFVLIVSNRRERVARVYTLILDPPGYAPATTERRMRRRVPESAGQKIAAH